MTINFSGGDDGDDDDSGGGVVEVVRCGRFVVVTHYSRHPSNQTKGQNRATNDIVSSIVYVPM